MYKIEIWKSDPLKEKGVLFLYMTFDTSDGYNKTTCMEKAMGVVIDLKKQSIFDFQLEEIENKTIYKYVR